MIEEGTPLYKLKIENEKLKIKDPRYIPIDEETELQMYEDLIDRLTNAGYEHYEISNFAKPGFRSQHNSSYWNQTPYIGLGAAAHSYNGRDCRRWNTDNLEQYIAGIENGKTVYEEEHLDSDTRYNDMVMTALRTCEGLCLSHLSAEQSTYCLQQAQRYLDAQLLTLHDHHLRLTRKGLFVSNMVMSDLMKTDD
jgi:oxygen-independent coproporphyrinogen-3 oxidase